MYRDGSKLNPKRSGPIELEIGVLFINDMDLKKY